MVLKKFLLEPYLNNRYYAGVEEGRRRSAMKVHAEWRAWYDRMKGAEAKGEQFDELPPGFEQPHTKE